MRKSNERTQTEFVLVLRTLDAKRCVRQRGKSLLCDCGTALRAHMVLPLADAVERMLDLRELASSLRVEAIEHSVIFFFDHSFFTVLIERCAITADVPFDAADTGKQVFAQVFEGGFGICCVHG